MLDLTDEQVKADIMDRLLRRHCWGEKYLPIDSLVNWMGKQIKRNGKRIRKLLDELVKEGFLFLHKRNTTTSLNPRMKGQIVEYIEKNLTQ